MALLQLGGVFTVFFWLLLPLTAPVVGAMLDPRRGDANVLFLFMAPHVPYVVGELVMLIWWAWRQVLGRRGVEG